MAVIVTAVPWYLRSLIGVNSLPIKAVGVAAPDTTQPTVTLVSPAEGEIAAGDDVVIDITAPGGLALIVLSLSFPDDPQRPSEVIYSSSRGTHARYEGTSINAITDGVRVTMTRLGGWPAATLRFDPDVVTASGVVNA